MDTVTPALTRFVASYLESYPTLLEPYDAEWRSPCETGSPFLCNETRVVPWRPLRRNVVHNDFGGLENALETEIHPDIKAYYGAYWSGGLEASAPDGHVSLLFLWNPEDIDRLIENLIGHAMAKQRAKAPYTVFFACTEPESDLFLSVDNESGAIVLDRPGYGAIRQVCDSLAEFLGTLTPQSPLAHPERVGINDAS